MYHIFAKLRPIFKILSLKIWEIICHKAVIKLPAISKRCRCTTLNYAPVIQGEEWSLVAAYVSVVT